MGADADRCVRVGTLGSPRADADRGGRQAAAHSPGLFRFDRVAPVAERNCGAAGRRLRRTRTSGSSTDCWPIRITASIGVRHWLDVVRYADSNGFEGDEDRPHAHAYRDFVIRALNDDLPFDAFVRWQLAGDELDPANPAAWQATGFCAAGPLLVYSKNDGTPLEREQSHYNELDDMLSTTGSALLGLTIACAVPRS